MTVCIQSSFLVEPMQCAICGNAIQFGRDTWVPTSDGQVVHIACADLEAVRIWAQRQRLAKQDAIVLLAVVMCLWLLVGTGIVMFISGMFGVGIHVGAHRHWWRTQALTLARWRRTLRHQG